jgi:hypothetical protein
MNLGLGALSLAELLEFVFIDAVRKRRLISDPASA